MGRFRMGVGVVSVGYAGKEQGQSQTISNVPQFDFRINQFGVETVCMQSFN